MSQEPTSDSPPASTAPPASLDAFSATIDTLTFLGIPVTFTTKLKPYHGDRLYCKAILNEDTLVVIIDEVGPATSAVPTNATITNARVAIALDGKSSETQALAGFGYTGGSLHLTAALSADEQNVALTVTETTPATGSPKTEVPYSFVIVLDDNQVTQLRWIDEPVQIDKANIPSQARVRNPPAKVAGVSGPFGTDSP
ncbi:MAG TPA: hypothetical protein VGU66_08795 [Candidatus Elarobacter sp.]|nr:hypothetical protein [Candidatus Elarobacter sp.]